MKLEVFTQAKNMGKALCDDDKYVLLNDYKKLEQQLQAYKDKEDKLLRKANMKEYDNFNDKLFSYYGVPRMKDPLNEGWKE